MLYTILAYVHDPFWSASKELIGGVLGFLCLISLIVLIKYGIKLLLVKRELKKLSGTQNNRKINRKTIEIQKFKIKEIEDILIGPAIFFILFTIILVTYIAYHMVH